MIMRTIFYFPQVDGGELLAYVEEMKQLDETYVRDIARQLCGALEYVHIAGVVHRDIKLENILRTSSVRVWFA